MARVAAALMVLGALGCGRVGYDPPGSDGGGVADDGGGDGDGATGADAGPLGPFGAATEVAGLAGPGLADDDPTLTGDMLEIYFQTDREGGADVWRATRASVADPFGVPAKVTELSTTASDDSPEISPDGLVLHLSSDRPGSQMLDLWRATRASRAQPWGAPVRVAELSSFGADFAVVTDQAELNSVVTTGFGGLDLSRASRASTASPWSLPTPITELNTPGWEADAWLSADGTEIFFTSDRPGGAGLHDLWRATRPSPAEPFGAAENVVELSTAGDEEEPWLSPDGRTIYFSRVVAGDTRIYTAER